LLRASQRTARTDRLHETVRSFLATLEKSVEPGEYVVLDGWTLEYRKLRSNVGETAFWLWGDNESRCYPELNVGSEKYLHGDFSCFMRGPERGDLIELAKRASRIAEQFAANLEREAAELDALTA